ncbi:MAG TPA: metalloregulator ArsR/SmtB family transcription factor [Solirubrobacteraceae bacterium]
MVRTAGRADARVQLLVELADETRFAALERLERGRASASELAAALDVGPTQLANHLRRLREAGLVRAERQGRLTIYELAEPGLREIFSMLNGLRGSPARAGGEPPAAATCYDHLAGRLGVQLFDYLRDRRALIGRLGEGEVELGPTARAEFARLGVEIPEARPRRMRAYACMDSLVGRPHLGGELGALLSDSLSKRGWIRPAERPRRLTLTPSGRRSLGRIGISVPAGDDG